ncbi:MAG: hypothetical protein ACRD2D_05200, partial [Terriglobales bacterium]
MNKKLWAWGLIGALAAVLGLTLAYWARTPAVVRRLPAGDTLVYVNFRPLRRAGWLGKAEPPKGPAYAAFVQQSGLDFERDLDEAACTLRGAPTEPEDATCILQGRFGAGFAAYLAAHARSRGQNSGLTTYQFPGWARPQQAITVTELDRSTVLVTNRGAAADALAQAQRRWAPGPELWRQRKWWGARLGYAAVDVMQLAARRQLDGSQEPWRGGQRLEAGLRATAQGLEIAGEEIMDNAADAAVAATWLRQQGVGPLQALSVTQSGARVQFL